MTAINYVRGDATRPQGEGTKIIVHCCNTVGAWGRGFVLALSRRWSSPERAYRSWHRDGETDVIINHAGQLISSSVKFALGEVQLLAVEPGLLYVANLIGQDGIRPDRNGRPPVRYEAIRLGLKRVTTYATEMEVSVHMPRIGAGLAGGRWVEVEEIINDELTSRDIPVTVYDLPKTSY
jgi:O-acetyl-ADP-ribose deacetylase (regulator of RNase III)